MRSFVRFLSVAAVLAVAMADSEWRTLRKFADMEAYENCFGEDVMKQYAVNMKRAVAKCSKQDAPELNLPPFKSTYRFVNTLLSRADQMDSQKMEFMFNMMNKMNRHNNDNDYRPFSNSYTSDSWMDKMMKHMMMKKMMNKFEMMFDNDSNYGSNYGSNKYESNVSPTKYMMNDMFNSNSNNFDEKSFMESMMKYKMMSEQQDSMNAGSNFRQKMMEILSRNKRQANNKKDAAVTLPSTLDIGDRLTEKVKDQQRRVQEKIGNMTCVLRELNMVNDQNEIDEKTQKAYFRQFDIKNKWVKDRIMNDIEMCVEISKNLPEDYSEQMNFPGYVNVAQIKYYMKCLNTCKMRTCMYANVKDKLEANFGPLQEILDQTQMTENQLLPLVMNILHGDDMEFDI